MPLFRKKNISSEPIVDPPRKVSRKRTERLYIGLTAEEKEGIISAAKSAGMTRTDYILSSVKKTRIIVVSDLATIGPELIRQGINLNMLTHRLNALNCVSEQELQETCRACKDAYRQLVRFIDDWDAKLKKLEVK